MSEKLVADLGNVQKTLFLPLWGRAVETRKAKPLLVDKAALEIIEKVDFDFSTIARNITELSQIAWIMRSVCVDAVITSMLEKHPRATIVNIGCGLDTTFDRIDNGHLLWYDLDLPDVIELRRRFIKESERRKTISTSFFEEGWLKEIIVRDTVLFVAAGVFYFFGEEEIKGFLEKLADEFPGGEILFDVCSPHGVKAANQMVVKRAGLDEKSFLRWGLEHTKDILSWDRRFSVLRTIHYFGDRRIGLKLRLLGFVSDLLKLQYMIHLRLGEDQGMSSRPDNGLQQTLLRSATQPGRTRRVSKLGEYEGYSEARFDGYERRSDYLTLSGGTKLAYDLLLPTRKGTVVGETLSVLLMHTTYLRGMKLVESGQIVFDELFDLPWFAKGALWLRAWFKKDGHIGDIVFRTPWLKRLLHHGYAVVVVERSGTGASSGILSPAFADVAVEIDEVLDWVAAQPWCDGNVGMFGTSMVAMAQYAAASAGNPHLKAILPVASSFDMYGSIVYPGGVNCTGFGRTLSGSTSVLERMIVPVDSDPDGAQLAAILEERRERSLSDVSAQGFRLAPFRDSDNPYLKDHKIWLDVGLYDLLDRINSSGVAVYNSGGWHDLFARDSLLWHANLTAPHRLHVRPLFHNNLGKSGADLDFGAEAHRWFDYWLKGIDNGIMEEPPVRYYVMGAPKGAAWRAAEQWPLPDEQRTRFYLAKGRSGSVNSVNDGFLHIRPPTDADGADAYTVDYSTSSGTDARWSAVVKEGKYPAQRANDEKALTYTTAPLEGDLEVIGHPVVHLWLATEAPDLDVFVYLEEVDAQGNVEYITEGNLRASHRSLGEAPFDNLGLPFHRSYKEDVAPIPASEPFELVFDLLPAAKRFQHGTRIRIAVTCADADNFDTPIVDPAPRIRLLRDAVHASFVELPIFCTFHH
jgi:putative CocE/NonD family hydrolase